MTSPQQQQPVNSNRPWDTTNIPLQNSTLRNANYYGPPQMNDNTNRSAPVLPPLPRTSPPAIPGALGGPSAVAGGYNSYLPYGSSGYNGMGYGGYGSYGMPYRGSLYNSYGTYGGVAGTGYAMGYPGVGLGGGAAPYGAGPLINDDAERRFIQYAEESSRNTFANVESIVRAFNSIAMMLDNTFFAMTSSFRAVLSVAENFGKLRTMFGHIWYSINIFRLFSWLYRKLMWLMGRKVPTSGASIAWKEAAKGTLPQPPPGGAAAPPNGSNWPTLAFLGMLVSAPYIISKFLPKYEDKSDPANWKSPGIKAKAAFDFVARGPSELTVQLNDEVTLAPTYVQDEMSLKNSGWAFGVCNGKSGIVPLNYLIINKTSRDAANNNNSSAQNMIVPPQAGPKIFPSLSDNNNSNSVNNNNNNNNNNNSASRNSNVSNGAKSHTKKVSFGENQIFENVDLEDYAAGIKGIRMKHHSHNNNNKTHHGSSLSNSASQKPPEKIVSDLQENTRKGADRILTTAPITNIEKSDSTVTQKDLGQTVANISISNSTPEEIKSAVQEIVAKQENNAEKVADVPPVQTVVDSPVAPETTISTLDDEIQQRDGVPEIVEKNMAVENSSPKEIANVVQERPAAETLVQESQIAAIPNEQNNIAVENGSPKEIEKVVQEEIPATETVVQESHIAAIPKEQNSMEKPDLQKVTNNETSSTELVAPKVHETDNSTSAIEATSQ